MEAGRHPHFDFRDLLRLHSRYGPLNCSTAQGGLCHEAPAQPVTQPNRSSATGANRQLSGWLLPPLVTRALGAHSINFIPRFALSALAKLAFAALVPLPARHAAAVAPSSRRKGASEALTRHFRQPRRPSMFRVRTLVRPRAASGTCRSPLFQRQRSCRRRAFHFCLIVSYPICRLTLGMMLACVRRYL